MGVFKDNAITDNGRLLLAEVQMGAVFTPTRIVMGSGYMPPGATARTMKDVAQVEQNLEIIKKQKANDGTVTLGGVYNNSDVVTGFFFRELGVYAKAVYEDGTEVDEVLYSYGNAGDTADYMPAYSTGQAVERQIDVVTYIGNDSTVNLELSSGIYVTHEALEERLEDVGGGFIIIEQGTELPPEQRKAEYLYFNANAKSVTLTIDPELVVIFDDNLAGKATEGGTE